VTGVVQGVGFRPLVFRLAEKHELSGWVLNSGGGVQIELEGPAAAVDAFTSELEAGCPPLGRIDRISSNSLPPLNHHGFSILPSEVDGHATAAVPADVAVCPYCASEMLDQDDRRFRYPFINCTQCGPRFTIIEAVPYDRAKTTMRAFAMCPDCEAEYTDNKNRRFHAEPVACPECGPRLAWTASGSEPHAYGETALRAAVEIIASGGIVAVKGLGGFHLACDAANNDTVARLRRLKDRPRKPFAVMSRSAGDVDGYAVLGEGERRILTSPKSPVVLLPKRHGSPLADDVAPGLGWYGVMVAYTPLHYLLFPEAGDFTALIMTSGNRRDEPIARTNQEALEQLSGIADGFLLHDRPIHNRVDDSIVQITDGGDVQMLRRARGYVPDGIPVGINKNIFAAGAELKSTFCLTHAGRAVLSQHVGDLDDASTLAFYEESFRKCQKLLAFEPEMVCCDLHPDYLSTRFAGEFARAAGLPLFKVQHHEAHVASVLAEHRFFENGSGRDHAPVLGVAFDGTGYGRDGAIWGGDFFCMSGADAERVAHIEYFPLPGGDKAVSDIWRSALAVLSSCGMEDHTAGSLADVPSEQKDAVAKMIEAGINCPLTSSAGRLFDAAAVIAGVGASASYEADAAMRLETAYRPGADPYPFDVVEGTPIRIGLQRFVRGMLSDRGKTAMVSSRFHATMAKIILAVAQKTRDTRGVRTVAFSGGVFQNRVMSSLARRLLLENDFQVLTNRMVPPNDGGVSLGQAWLASRKKDG